MNLLPLFSNNQKLDRSLCELTRVGKGNSLPEPLPDTRKPNQP
jgi:hypothetical protein